MCVLYLLPRNSIVENSIKIGIKKAKPISLFLKLSVTRSAQSQLYYVDVCVCTYVSDSICMCDSYDVLRLPMR